MTPCPEHKLAIPLSWKTSRPSEWKAFYEKFNEEYSTKKWGFQTYPPLCPKCRHFEFKLGPQFLLRDMKGSLRGTELEYLVKS